MFAEQGDRAVPIGVGHPHGEVAPLRRHRGTPVVWLVRHAVQFARSAGLRAASQTYLTTRQIPVGPPVRLPTRARDCQCGGLCALPATGPGGHRRLHGQRWRQGDPGGGLARRGHHHARRGGGPSCPAALHRDIPPTRCGSPRLGPPTWTRRTPPRSPLPSGCPPMSAPTTSGARCARAPAPCWRRCVAAAPPWSSARISATACRPARTRRRAATPGPPLLVGDGPALLAEFVAAASATDEFTDRWRAPGDRVSKLWEERFGENRYLALGRDALDRALKTAGLTAGDVGRLVVTGMHGRAVSGLTRRLGLDEGVLADDLTRQRRAERRGPSPARPRRHARVAGRIGRARARPVVLLHLADGADAMVLRTGAGAGLAGARPGRWPNRWPTARHCRIRSSCPGGAS